MTSRHEAGDLEQMQSLPLDAKIIMSKRRIRDWYDYWDGMVYVSVSGKDSNVLKHLVKNTPGVYDVPNVFVNTGLEYPEVRTFNVSQPDVTTIYPKVRFNEVIRKYGYPVATKEQAAFVEEYRTTQSEKLRNIRLNGNKWGRGKISKRWLSLIDAPFKVSDKCCDIMKKIPAKEYEKETGRKAIVGTMAYESSQRKSNWMLYGCNAFNKKRPTSQPLSFWTEQDILEYIVRFNVPYPSVYGEIKQILHNWLRQNRLYVLYVRLPPRKRTEQIPAHERNPSSSVRLLYETVGSEGPRIERGFGVHRSAL